MIRGRIGDFGLYAIATEPASGYEGFAKHCVREGVRILQLRDKVLPDRELLDIARRMGKITRGSRTLFFINDRPDIAILSGADGVHLGQDDLPPADVRQLLPPTMLLGLSTHNPAQARTALEFTPDYIGFGPIHPTPTKAKPDPVQGLDPLKEVLSFSAVPVVAIGGLFPENLGEVLDAGTRNIALVRYLMEPVNPSQRIREIQQILDHKNRN